MCPDFKIRMFIHGQYDTRYRGDKSQSTVVSLQVRRR